MCRSHTRTPRAQAETHDRTVRASDFDRERTADVLREHGGAGRLSPEELEDRAERAFAAKTLADLDALTADLPPAERRDEPRHAPAWRPGPVSVLLVVAALIAVSAVLHYPVVWFALIPLLFFKSRLYAPHRPVR